MRTEKQQTADGRTVIKCAFERNTGESDDPVILTCWELYTPTDFDLFDGNRIIEFRSAVRKDDLTPIEITKEEKRAVIESILEYAKDHDPDWKL